MDEGPFGGGIQQELRVRHAQGLEQFVLNETFIVLAAEGVPPGTPQQREAIVAIDRKLPRFMLQPAILTMRLRCRCHTRRTAKRS